MISVVLPCLNERDTVGQCVDQACKALNDAGMEGEVVVADNGSTDGSPDIARAHGARVVDVSEPGYGSALAGGIKAAAGEYVIMADADLTYDFAQIGGFVHKLDEGFDLVMGNRFAGGIDKGAMPWLNHYIGNPILSFIGRLFFGPQARDFHCGMRAFRKSAYESLGMRSTGMEFASEMVVKALLQGLRVTELPVKLHPDAVGRKPHLRPWRDGWRHLRFMLLFSPRWLFLYPGLALFAIGAVVGAIIERGPVTIGNVQFDIHTLLLAAFCALIGFQLIVFAVFTKVFATQEGFHRRNPTYDRAFDYVKLETGLVVGVAMTLIGIALTVLAVLSWGTSGYGHLDPSVTMREVIPAFTLVAIGVETIFASFFLSILGIRR